MSETPSYAPPTLHAASPRISAAALTSFILGLILCIPLVTSLAALICAIIGFKATRNNAKRGRGFAITGLILSIVGLVAWSAVGGFVIFLFSASAAPRATLHIFVHNMAIGDIPAASAVCDAAIKPTDIDTLHTYVAGWGTYSDLTCTNINIGATAAGESCTLGGTARFASGSHPFNAVLQKTASGDWKIAGFHIY